MGVGLFVGDGDGAGEGSVVGGGVGGGTGAGVGDGTGAGVGGGTGAGVGGGTGAGVGAGTGAGVGGGTGAGVGSGTGAGVGGGTGAGVGGSTGAGVGLGTKGSIWTVKLSLISAVHVWDCELPSGEPSTDRFMSNILIEHTSTVNVSVVLSDALVAMTSDGNTAVKSKVSPLNVRSILVTLKPVVPLLMTMYRY